MSVHGAQICITKAATSWAGMTPRPPRFGGVEYVIGKREIGHIRGDTLYVRQEMDVEQALALLCECYEITQE